MPADSIADVLSAISTGSISAGLLIKEGCILEVILAPYRLVATFAMVFIPVAILAPVTTLIPFPSTGGVLVSLLAGLAGSAGSAIPASVLILVLFSNLALSLIKALFKAPFLSVILSFDRVFEIIGCSIPGTLNTNDLLFSYKPD